MTTSDLSPLSLADRRAFVIDDHPAFTELLAAVIKKIAPGMAVYTATSLADARAVLRERFQPSDFVFLDLRLGAVRGFEAVDAIQREYPSAILAIVSGFEEPGRLRRAYARQVKGYLPKSLSTAELHTAIDTFLRTSFWYPIEALGGGAPLWNDRAIAVMELVNLGMSDKEIARALGLAPDTVRWRLSVEYQRHNVTNRVLLLKRAQLDGIVD